MSRNKSRLLFMLPPVGASSVGQVGSDTLRAIDIRISRRYVILPIHKGDTVRYVDGCVIPGDWQHLTIPRDLRLHLTATDRHRELPVPTSPPNAWRRLFIAVSPNPDESIPVLFPPGRTSVYGPGVLVVAPDVPDASERWRFVVEALAGPDGALCDVPRPFQEAVPIPTHGGNIVFNAPLEGLLGTGQEGGTTIAFRGWWLPAQIAARGVLFDRQCAEV